MLREGAVCSMCSYITYFNLSTGSVIPEYVTSSFLSEHGSVLPIALP